ncbi:MAG: selenide, water dikinase SelD [Chlorobi bacterium]|nr:selenide, water dikinase SelD [Chlorobiota bacterium]
MDRRIYLDYNASTPIDPEVAAEMRPFLDNFYGNPSSNHWYGLQAKITIENARKRVASLIHAESDEIIFTSGGTESNNMAIRGIARTLQHKGKHIITSSVEHPSVLEVCRFLEKEGYSVTYLETDQTGYIHPDSLKKVIRPDTILVTVMHANNEVGTIQPISDLAAICREHQIILHTDAAQSAGKIPADVRKLGVDLLSLAGHKLYGPKGIGALFIRRGVSLEKLLLGADHERNLRPGTENTLEIAGLGKACEIAARDLEKNMIRFTKTTEALWEGLHNNLPQIRRNGNPDHCLPNTLSISFPDLEANLLVSELENIAVSSGAACHTDKVEVSHVLEAMHIPVEYAMGTIRFSTGRQTTPEDIMVAVDEITKTVRRLQPVNDHIEIPGQFSGDIALTHFTSGLGCACKMRPQALEKVLREIPVLEDIHTLVGPESADDAAVYRLDDEHALVKTVDFFTPIVDDPWWFGAIAAANALSDIYAMGASPLFALNIAGFPSNRLPLSVLQQILQGATDKCNEAGIPILGGHTIDDNEPKFGMVITGMVHPDRIITNRGAQPGDKLILTKPLGTGIIATGIKRGLVSQDEQNKIMELMATLNKEAADVFISHTTHACTDITGFGLLGHLGEVTRSSKTDATLNHKMIPVLPEAERLGNMDIIPGGTKNNMEYTAPFVKFAEDISPLMHILLNDAQTSGGLLAAVPENEAETTLRELKKKNIPAVIIGEITHAGEGMIKVI